MSTYWCKIQSHVSRLISTPSVNYSTATSLQQLWLHANTTKREVLHLCKPNSTICFSKRAYTSYNQKTHSSAHLFCIYIILCFWCFLQSAIDVIYYNRLQFILPCVSLKSKPTIPIENNLAHANISIKYHFLPYSYTWIFYTSHYTNYMRDMQVSTLS